jgi:hypothetical protein
MLPFGGIVRYHMAEVNYAARELPLKPTAVSAIWRVTGGSPVWT